MSFWAKYAAQFDFKDRVIKMMVDGENVQVPFTIGDEKRNGLEMHAEENVALYALEDTVVPPRSGYLVPTRPEQGLKVKMGAWDTWTVSPRTEEEMEELHKRAEEEQHWHDKLEQRAQGQAELRAEELRQRGQQTPRWDDGVKEMQEAMHEEEWAELGQFITAWHLSEDCSDEEEERECAAEETLESLHRAVGNGTAQTVTHPKWHDEWGPVIPINGINMDDEPLVIRKGERVAVGTRMHSEQVARVEQQAGASFVHADHEETERKAKEEGTMSGEMIKDIEHKEGDWRRGRTWKQIIEDTKEGEREKQFQGWKEAKGAEVKIGEEGEEAVTAEVRELYLRLIFAYQEVIAENPKKPGIIPGIYHKILLKEENTRPCRERVRCGAPAEEKIKEDEIQMLLNNDIVEECNSEWSSNLVVVRKKDGTPRTCVDLRRVNIATRFDCFPLGKD